MLRGIANTAVGFKFATTDTYANIVANYPAASYSGSRARATDLGINVISDGTRWIPDGVQVLLHTAIPIGIAPTGTMANNGAVTLGTALDAIYTTGLYLHYPASAIVSGSTAGFYWTVMSSTTVGTVFNNSYTPGTAPAVPGSNTAFVTTGPGAFTGSTAALDTASLTVPASLLGINGGIRASYTATMNSSAGNKFLTTKYGGSNFHLVNATSAINYTQQVRFSNRGVAAVQVLGTGGSGTNFGSTGVAPNTFAINSAADQTLAMNIQRATATDWIIVHDLLWEVLP